MDYTVGDTIYLMFTTRQFSDGVPTVLSGTPVVSAYENDSVIQITAGITLGVDHDGVSGMNLLTIVGTGANGYESGKDYNLVITTGTVGGVSVVGEVIGTFSLGRSAAAVDLANGTDGLSALKILIDTIDDFLDTEIAAIKAVTDALPDAGALTTIGTDTARLTAVRAAILTDWINGNRLDLLLDAVNTTTPPTVGQIQTELEENGASILDTLRDRLTAARASNLDELGAANLPADVDTLLTRVSDVVANLVWNVLRSVHTTAGSMAESFRGVVNGAAEAGTLSTTVMTTDLTEATDDHYIGRTVVWISGALDGQASDITDYAGADGRLTFTAVTEAPTAGDRFVLV